MKRPIDKFRKGKHKVTINLTVSDDVINAINTIKKIDKKLSTSDVMKVYCNLQLLLKDAKAIEKDLEKEQSSNDNPSDDKQ